MKDKTKIFLKKAFKSVEKEEINLKENDIYTLIDNDTLTLVIKKGLISQIILNTNNEKFNWNFSEENFLKAFEMTIISMRKDKYWQILINECYEKCDQQEDNMRELGLINYGDDTYYFNHIEEFKKDWYIAEKKKVLKINKN